VRSDSEQWQLQGSAAERYERYLVPIVTLQWARDLVSRVGVARGDRLLDVACGTGIVARTAAECVGGSGRVVGLDLNSGMLAVARSFPKIGGVSMEWCEGSALALPFDEDEFDVVLCQFGLQFLPDPGAALREMRRALVGGRPIGASVFAEIELNPAALAFSDSLDVHLGEGASAAKRSEHSLADSARLRALFQGARFSRVQIETVEKTSRYPSIPDYVRFQLLATPLSGVLDDYDEPERERLIGLIVEELSGRLARFVRGREFAFPQVAHIAIATA